jgi:Na+-translocating ferredoxin:NAD+ oxidoreductase RnfG subunit
MKAVKHTFVILIPILFLCFITAMVYGSMQSHGFENRFEEILKEYDSQESVRMKGLESESVLRAYDLEADHFNFLVATQGYEDILLLKVILDHERVNDVQVLYHDETEDYGTYVVEEWYLSRLMIPYVGPLKSVKYRKNSPEEVIAITGATITSDAVVAGINLCIEQMEGFK